MAQEMVRLSIEGVVHTTGFDPPNRRRDVGDFSRMRAGKRSQGTLPVVRWEN